MKPISYWFKEKLWLTPAVYSGLAVLLSIGFFYVDLLLVERFKDYIPSILLTKVELAKTIMGTLSGALLTMTTFTFSTILVVLTMYSSQFSPRTLKNFVHDRLTWRVLGIFLGGFIYNTLSLLFMRDDLYTHDVISTFVGILIAFSCLATFAYFIHYIASTVQVGKLVNTLVKDAERVISSYGKLQEKDCVSSEGWKPSGVKNSITSEKAGYIEFIAFEKIVEYAEKQNIEIEIAAGIGDYIYEGKQIIHVYTKESQQFSLKEFYSIGDERTSEQDIGFAMQKLVEVALRAISPGINDPNTANEIILRIGRLLGKMGHLITDSLVLNDSKGTNRLLYRFPSYDDILYKTFYQLAHYGKEDVSVLSSMINSLKIAATLSPDSRHESLWEIQLYVLEGLAQQELKSLDRSHLQEKIDDFAVVVNYRAVNLYATEKT